MRAGETIIIGLRIWSHTNLIFFFLKHGHEEISGSRADQYSELHMGVFDSEC